MKSVFGWDEKTVAALSYLFGFVSGIFTLVMERNNKFVRFHALQSTLWFLTLMIVQFVLGIIGRLPLLGGLAGLIDGILGFIAIASAIILMVKAFSGAKTKIPIIGDVAWNQVGK